MPQGRTLTFGVRGVRGAIGFLREPALRLLGGTPIATVCCAAVQRLHGETEELPACAHPTLTGECPEQLRVITPGLPPGEIPRDEDDYRTASHF